MVLDLKDIFSGELSILPFSCQLDLSDTERYGCYPFVTPILAKGAVTASAGCVRLEAEASFVYEAPCDRCAAPVRRQYDFRFSHELAHSLEQEDDGEYILVEEGDLLDLDELLRSDILLELPYKYLCQEDCKGLCPSCGKNLNEGPCGCNLHQIDPRLEVLSKLID